MQNLFFLREESHVPSLLAYFWRPHTVSAIYGLRVRPPKALCHDFGFFSWRWCWLMDPRKKYSIACQFIKCVIKQQRGTFIPGRPLARSSDTAPHCLPVCLSKLFGSKRANGAVSPGSPKLYQLDVGRPAGKLDMDGRRRQTAIARMLQLLVVC